jgi:hypothetical protein
MKKKFVLVLSIVLLLSSTTFTYAQQIKTNETDQLTNSNDVMIDQLTEDMLLNYIEELVEIAEKYEDARFTGTQGCTEGKNFIIQEFANMRLEVNTHEFTAYGTFFPYNLHKYTGYNIEAILPGSSNSDKFYIISAHYDTVVNTPSADDNSAGVAAVLCAAKILSQYQFNHDIHFICWSGEEQGLIGSNAYAYDLYESNENLIAAINLDMMAYTSDEIQDDENKVMVYETCSNSLIGSTIQASQNPDYSPLISLEVIPSEDDEGHRSDQASFCKYAHDAIFIHEFTWNEMKDTSGDTIENIDLNYATRVARLAMATIATWASSPIIENNAPDKPQTPNGPDTIKPFVSQTFTTISEDVDGDQIYYLFDWGDGTHSGWVGPLNSGEIAHASHKWTEKGEYKIQVKAKDEHGIQSGWSDSPKLMQYDTNIFTSLFLRFPLILKIMNKIFEI